MSARKPTLRVPLLLAADDTHQSGLRQPAVHLDAPACELIGDAIRCARFLEGELGMCVHVSPESDEIGVEAADAIDGVAHVQLLQ